MFPRWVYHKDKAAQIVSTEEELSSLGDGWADSPSELGIVTCPSSDQE